jgi:hypothetical protein
VEKEVFGLEQRSFVAGQQKLTVEKDYLIWEIKKIFTSREERIALNVFGSDPIKYRAPNFRPLAGFIICAFLFVFGITDKNAWRIALLAVPMGVLSILALAFFIESFRERLSFYNRYNGIPIITLALNRPNPSSFQLFVEKFKDKIKSNVDAQDSKAAQSIAGELERLHSLTEKNVLTQEEFEKLKCDLIEGKSKIGF